MSRNHRAPYIFLLVVWILTASLLGCAGPAGVDGDNAFLADSLPPVVQWLAPAPWTEIDSAVELRAKATDDQGVWRLRFYIAGLEYPGKMKDSADSLAQIYSYKWYATYFPASDYPLSARASDASRNHTTTPEIMVKVVHPPLSPEVKNNKDN